MKVEADTITDEVAIKAILSMCGSDIAEDGASVESYKLNESDRWLLLSVDDRVVGLGHLEPRGGAMLAGHLNVLPQHRQAMRRHAQDAIYSYVVDNTRTQKLITEVPAIHKHCIRHAIECGMAREGRITNCYRKNGDLVDVEILGIDRQTMEGRLCPA